MAPTHTQPFLLIFFLLLFSVSYSKKHDKPFDRSMINFQTGIDLGSTFAGGMTFDKFNNRLFLTGGTYARGFFLPESSSYRLKGKMNSDCFFTAIQLVNSTNAAEDVAQWKQPTRLGYVRDIEACSTAHFLEDHNRIFLGASATGQSFGETDVQGDALPHRNDVALFGEVISLSLDHVYNIAPTIPQHYIFGGHGLFNAEVSYPFAITSPTKSVNKTGEDVLVELEEAIFVASLYSKYGGQWSEDLNATELDISSPYIEGNTWGIAIQKIKVTRSNATDTDSLLANTPHMEREWSKNIATSNFQKLQAIDMVYVNGFLLLAGSTYDFDSQFAGEERKYTTSQDYDGFLIKIDPATGELKSSNSTEEKMKLRIQSDYEVDDVIHGICLHPSTNETENIPYVYVVGSKRNELDEAGNVTGSAFIMQIDLFSMEVIWKDYIHGLYIESTDCAITDDGKLLYVIGNAKNGSALHGWTSNGGDDVWIRQYNAISGHSNWEEQIGSDQDDSLAKGGAIVIGSNNSAIIYGNTRGSIGRTRAIDLDIPDTTNDIFVMSIDYRGAYLAPNPNKLFQIPQYYLGERNNSHSAFISCMIVFTFILLAVVIGKEVSWEPINSKKRTLTQSEKRSMLQGNQTVPAHSSESDDDSFFLFQSDRGVTKRRDMV